VFFFQENTDKRQQYQQGAPFLILERTSANSCHPVATMAIKGWWWITMAIQGWWWVDTPWTFPALR